MVRRVLLASLCWLPALRAEAQTVTDLAVLKGPAPPRQRAGEHRCGQGGAGRQTRRHGRHPERGDPATDAVALRGQQQTGAAVETVGRLAPEAGYLLTTAFPSLTLEQANQILTETEGPGGGFLDDGSAFGVYSRLNLYAAAAGRAAAMAGR